MAKDNWSDEETRFFFQLYAKERRKGNRTSTGMNQTGKENIIKKFEERFKRKYEKWNPFKNRYDACKKKYTGIRMLIHNRAEVRYDDMGRLNMPDDWWKQRELEWPGAKKHKIKLDANLDMYEEEFKAVVVTGAEGWSAQAGEASVSINSTGDGDDFDEANSVDKEFPVPETQNQTQTQSGSSRAQKRRREKKDIAIETVAKRTESILEKNNVAKQFMEYERAFSVETAIEILHGLPGVMMWTSFYDAAVLHLVEDDKSRRAFLAYPRAEDKIKYLELRLGRNLDDDY